MSITHEKAAELCTAPDCNRPARCAIRTTRPKRDDLRVTLYADNRTAPQTAQRYCQICTLSLMAELVSVVVDGDEKKTT